MNKKNAHSRLATVAKQKGLVVQTRRNGKDADDIRILNASTRKVVASGTLKLDASRTGYDSQDVLKIVRQLKTMSSAKKAMNSSRRRKMNASSGERTVNGVSVSDILRYWDKKSLKDIADETGADLGDLREAQALVEDGENIVDTPLLLKPDYEDKADAATSILWLGKNYNGNTDVWYVLGNRVYSIDQSDVNSLNSSRRRKMNAARNSENPLPKYYTFMTVEQAAKEFSVPLSDLTEDAADVEAAGYGTIIGYLKAKSEYAESLSYDGYDYLIVLDDNGDIYAGQHTGGGGRPVSVYDVSEETIEDCLAEYEDYEDDEDFNSSRRKTSSSRRKLNCAWDRMDPEEIVDYFVNDMGVMDEDEAWGEIEEVESASHQSVVGIPSVEDTENEDAMYVTEDEAGKLHTWARGNGYWYEIPDGGSTLNSGRRRKANASKRRKTNSSRRRKMNSSCHGRKRLNSADDEWKSTLATYLKKYDQKDDKNPDSSRKKYYAIPYSDSRLINLVENDSLSDQEIYEELSNSGYDCDVSDMYRDEDNYYYLSWDGYMLEASRHSFNSACHSKRKMNASDDDYVGDDAEFVEDVESVVTDEQGNEIVVDDMLVVQDPDTNEISLFVPTEEDEAVPENVEVIGEVTAADSEEVLDSSRKVKMKASRRKLRNF